MCHRRGPDTRNLVLLRQHNELTEESPGAWRIQPQGRIHRFTGKIAADPYRNHQVCVSQEVGSARVTGANTSIVEL